PGAAAPPVHAEMPITPAMATASATTDSRTRMGASQSLGCYPMLPCEPAQGKGTWPSCHEVLAGMGLHAAPAETDRLSRAARMRCRILSGSAQRSRGRPQSAISSLTQWTGQARKSFLFFPVAFLMQRVL